MQRANVIVDANIALHYRRMDEVDWPGLVGCDECNVVIVPALMAELERKKATGSSPTIRKRAAKAIDFLVGKMDEVDPITLRPNCTLVFRYHEPLIDFAASLLSPEVDDDRYIASALEIAGETGADTFIASGDGGLKLKLRSRPLKALALPESLKLPEEVDPETKQLRQAKQELEQLKASRPKPRLAFVGQEDKLTIAIPDRIIPNVSTVGEIMAAFPQEETPKPDPRSFLSNTSGFDISQLSSLSASLVERRNESRRRYYEEYQQYLNELDIWLERLCRIEQIQFSIWNDGLAAATNIKITVVAPEGTIWIDSSDLPDKPKEPDKPGSRSMWDDLRPLNFNPRLHHPPRDGDVSVSEDGRRIRASFTQLNPHSGLNLEKVRLEMLSREFVGKSSSFSSRISFTEGAPIEQRLPFESKSSGTIDLAPPLPGSLSDDD